jgi:hypothetical protein
MYVMESFKIYNQIEKHEIGGACSLARVEEVRIARKF